MNWHLLTDLFWPTLEGAESKVPDAPKWDYSDKILRDELDALIAAEEDRRKGTDTKLQGLLVLSSVTATFVMGFVAFVTQNTGTYTFFSAACIIGGGAYLILQFLRTLWAAIAGLTPRAFMQLIAADLAANPDERAEGGTVTDNYHVRLTNEKLKCYAYNGWVTNKKLSQLNLAHRALKNALGMLFLLALTLAVIAIRNLPENSRSRHQTPVKTMGTTNLPLP